MKNKAEKQRIATNLSLYMKINGYTHRTFALAVGISQNTLKALMIGKMRNENKFQNTYRKLQKVWHLKKNSLNNRKKRLQQHLSLFKIQTKCILEMKNSMLSA